MAAILIKPISAETLSGMPVMIDSLYPISSDFLQGTITAPNGSKFTASWDKNGICRDHDSSFNLNTDNGALQEAIETAEAYRKNIDRP